MKSKDQALLEEAYNKIIANKLQNVEEKINWKGAVAGAALGLSSLGSSVAAEKNMTADDFADKEMIKHASSTETSNEAQSPQAAFEQAMELVRNGKSVTEHLMKLIVTDKLIAQRCAHFMTLQGVALPKILKSVVGDYDTKLKASLVGP